jgi:hypothetical protein
MGSDEGDMMAKAKNGGRKYFTAPSQGGEGQEEDFIYLISLNVRQP